MISNTVTFDFTGHPASHLPCAISNGLSVYLMQVAAVAVIANPFAIWALSSYSLLDYDTLHVIF